MRKSNIIVSMLFLLGSSLLPFSAHGAVNWEVVKTWEVSGPPIDIAHSGDDKWTFLLMATGEVLVYSKAGKLEGRIGVDPSTTDIAVSRKGNMLFLTSEKNKKVTTVQVDFITEINIDEAPFMGPASAKATIIVFSDFQ